MRPPSQRSIYTEESGAGSTWLTTFNDMITLLMVFFVLLFSMGSMDANRFKTFQNALQSAMGVLYEGQRAPVGTISDQSTPVGRQLPIGLDRRTEEDREPFEALTETRGLEAEYTARGIQLTLDDRLLFGTGKAALKGGGKLLLARVASIIRPFRRNIRVEGHTDNLPIATGRYPSNWELSIARAIVVVKFLIDNGNIEPHRLSAAGYGDSKPRVANDSPANRAINRRVEIILGPVIEKANTE